MNNAKLCVAVIILCLVAPMMVGYVWPVSEADSISYEVGSPTNITTDLQNDYVGVYSDFTDPFMNNEFLLNDSTGSSQWAFYNRPVMSTDISDQTTFLPDIRCGFDSITVTTVGVFYTQTLSAFVEGYSAKVFLFDAYGAESINGTGFTADRCIYFPDSERFYYIDSFGMHQLESVPSTITWTFSSAGTHTIYFAHTEYYYYANPAYGFYIPNYTAIWYNGHENRAIDILFQPVANDLIYMTFNQGLTEEMVVTIYCSSTKVYLQVWFASTQTSHVEELGEISAFPCVLFNLDYDTKKVSLSGLKGMDSFLDDYTSKIRHTVSIDWEYPREFSSFNIVDNVSYGGFKWYVPRTESDLTSVPGIHYNYVKIEGYAGSGNGQIQLRMPQIYPYGTAISILVNNSVVEYGTITIDDKIAFGGKEYSLNNLLITKIENTVYVNGDPLIELSVPVTSCTITFLKDWLVNVYYYPIEDLPSTEYGWESGGFGLDENGYCIVGMITSAFTGLCASLYGRRSGSKMALVTFVSGVIGAVYLLILMGGL